MDTKNKILTTLAAAGTLASCETHIPHDTFQNEVVKVTKMESDQYAIQWLNHGDSLSIKRLSEDTPRPESGYYNASGVYLDNNEYAEKHDYHTTLSFTALEALTKEKAEALVKPKTILYKDAIELSDTINAAKATGVAK